MNEEGNNLDELLDEATIKQTDSDVDELPEAPNSATVKIWVEGYGTMFTMRDYQMSNVVKKVKILIKLAKENGWKPKWDDDKPVIVNQNNNLGSCPKCGSPLVEAETKKGLIIKCSTNKWNKFKKKAEGCDYVKWPEDEDKGYETDFKGRPY